MSIIQAIRDKYAKVAIVLIALSLIGFILTDYFSSRSRMAGGGRGSENIGSVNGIPINSELFASKKQVAEQQMVSTGYPQDQASAIALDRVWDEELRNVLMTAEEDKLGLIIGPNELGDILYGPNMPADLKQQLTDSNGYDPLRAKQMVDRMLKDPKVDQAQKDNFNNYVLQLKQQRLHDKYVTLLSNTVNLPRWFVEKQNADQALLANVAVVREQYTSISDSSVKVTDKEIQDYIDGHKNAFKQTAGRNIAFVMFNAAPTAADSVAIKARLSEARPEFDTTNDIGTFVASKGGQYFNGYTAGSAMQMSAKDSIQRLAKNQVMGPYLDGNSYVLARMIDTRVLPDSVKCRHILIGTVDRQGNPMFDDSTAHARADSIKRAIAAGANFDTLESRLSTDAAAHQQKGVMTFSSTDIQGENFAKEFGDFILFNGKPGSKEVIKTQFGWHYIEILEFIKPETHYKVAYLSEPIVPSAATTSTALEEAQRFAGEAKDIKGFEATYEKTLKPQGRVRSVAQNIRRADGQVPTVGYSRDLVRAVYDVKRGQVTKPVKVEYNYVVAVVTDDYDEGTQSVAAARPQVEPILRNKKKAEMLKQKIGKVTTLEAAATALGGKSVEPIDSVRMTSNDKLGFEPTLIGAIFNPANKGKVVPEVIAGINAVYVVRVDNVTATAQTNDVAEQRKNGYLQGKQFVSNPQYPNYPAAGLLNAAKIKDRRGEFY